MPHLSDARGSKSPFQLTTVLAFVKQIAASTVAKDMKPGSSVWAAIGESVSQLVQEGGRLLPLALETENVLKSQFDLFLRGSFTDNMQLPAWPLGSQELTRSKRAWLST